MSKAWKIVFILAGIFVVLVIGYWAYLHYRSYTGPHATAIEAIHPDAVFFAQSDDIRAALYKLTTETEFWPQLISDARLDRFHDEFRYLDSLVTSYGWLNELIEMQKFTLSFSRSPDGRYHPVFMLELSPGDFTLSFEQLVREVNGAQSIVLKRDFEKAVIYTVNLSGPEELFFYAVYKGLFIGSFDEALVMNSVIQLNSRKSLVRDEAFQRVHSTAGKNVEANLYIHIPNFSMWASHQLPEKYLSATQDLKKFGSWTEMDILVKNDNLLFNGYTVSNDTVQTILDRFQQAPQTIRATEILPYNIRWMMHWGIADFRAFLKSSMDKVSIERIFSQYERNFRIGLEEEFISWIGHELVLAAPSGPAGNSHPIIIIHSRDVVKAALALGEMESKVNNTNKINAFVVGHRDYKIRKLALNSLFRDLFGEPFPEMENCFYTTLKDYVIFSSEMQDLMQVIDQFYSQKTLALNSNYKLFSDNISDRSNIYLYCNLQDPDPFIKDLSKALTGHSGPGNLLHFEGFALQFSYINEMFYTNMFLHYNPGTKDVALSNWETELESGIALQPFLVKNQRSGKINIVVFDDRNTMYLLDQTGRIQWQLSLTEPPTGDVFMVDYFGNNKLQYLFSTKNYIYLVDLNGNYVADYPGKLLAPSTGSLAVFDYDEDRNYRLLIALDDNKVHNFDLQLSPVRGWEKIQLPGIVKQAVQHQEHGGKDYLLVADDQGNVRITDRKGVERIKPRSKVNKAVNSIFHINRTNNKGMFLSTESDGKVVYIDEKGQVSRTDFGEFGPDHFFFYDDFDGNDHHDFIFVDRNRMVVFDRFKKVITEQQFAEVVTRSPVLFSWAGRKYMGLILEAAGELQVYDHQGRCFQDRYMEGTVPFAVGSLEPGKFNLVTGKGAKVISYQLN